MKNLGLGGPRFLLMIDEYEKMRYFGDNAFLFLRVWFPVY